MMDDTSPMEAAHSASGDGRRTCEECGARVKDLKGHTYKMHRVPRPDRPPGRPRASRARPKSLKPDLEVTFAFVAEMWAMRDPICGSVCRQQVPKIAEAWDAWAASSPQVRRILEAAMMGAGPVGVITAHLPVIMVVVAHHGPNRDQYFPPPAPPEPDPSMNGTGPEEPIMYGPAGPVPSGYAPPSGPGSPP